MTASVFYSKYITKLNYTDSRSQRQTGSGTGIRLDSRLRSTLPLVFTIYYLLFGFWILDFGFFHLKIGILRQTEL